VVIVKFFAIINIEADLEVVGPFGTYLYDEVGTTKRTPDKS